MQILFIMGLWSHSDLGRWPLDVRRQPVILMGILHPIIVLSLALAALPLSGAAAAADSRASFDQAGSPADAIVSAIKSDAASLDLAAPPVGSGRAVRPVVVTVSGLAMGNIAVGSITYDAILKLWKRLFPHKAPNDKLIRQVLQQMREALNRLKRGSVSRAPNYVETEIREAARRSALDVEIVDFPWTRDPRDTDPTVERFEEKLLALRDSPQTGGRPLYIVTHSWGSILIHEALVRLERKGQIVEVQRLVSMGSPLTPRNLFVWLYIRLYDWQEHLEAHIAKPQGVRQWENLYADLDPFSDPIAAADENFRVDAPAASYLDRLKAMLSSGDKEAVRKDIAALRDAGQWHFAYLMGFQATLHSLHERVSWDILQAEAERVLPPASN